MSTDKVPTISIVTPSYNQAQFIAQTIESVLSQEGAFRIEYFVVDGGSTDGSVDIIRGYADLVANRAWPTRCTGISMEWVSQHDHGQSDAINKGLRQSTGEILSYINSDDLYCPGAFQRVVTEFLAHPAADFVYGDGDVVDEAGDAQWEWLSRPYNYRLLTSYHYLWNDFTNYIMQQATFWRRAVIDNIGYFDDTFHYAMDVEYWVRAGHAGLSLRHIPLKLGKFRLIPGTKSLSSPTVFWEDHLEIRRRYRGAHTMSPLFAYYFFNLARHLGFDLDSAFADGRSVLDRWRTLPPSERHIIERQAAYGRDLACLLIAIELTRRGETDKADRAFRRGVESHKTLTFHPFALIYAVRRSFGQRGPAVDHVAAKAISLYRRQRFDYRYHKSISERSAK